MALLEAILEFIQNFFVNTGIWFHDLLVSQGLPDMWVRIISLGTGALVLTMVPVFSLFFFIWYERKIAARIGSRLGPNNSNPLAYGGPYGTFQLFADAIKMLTKEDIIPTGADRWVFNIAPILIFTAAIFVWAVVPFGEGVIGADINIGIFYILSLESVQMIAMLMAGWGSNNKYAVLGAIRSIATLISYEIPKALSVMTVVMLAGSLSMAEIVAAQKVWYIVAVPISAVVFFATSLSELGRRPFDLVEADSEIVAGCFIEYSGMKFGMFYLAEFMNQLLISVLFSILFLGGWQGPGASQTPILGTVWLVVKVFTVNLVIQFSQYTLPRLRIDQILAFSWKFLTPLSLINICVVALIGKAVPYDPQTPWIQAGAFLSANLVLAVIFLTLLGILGQRAQRRKTTLLISARPETSD